MFLRVTSLFLPPPSSSLPPPLSSHEGPVWQVAWAHPKFGNILASCSYDRKVSCPSKTGCGLEHINLNHHCNRVQLLTHGEGRTCKADCILCFRLLFGKKRMATGGSCTNSVNTNPQVEWLFLVPLTISTTSLAPPLPLLPSLSSPSTPALSLLPPPLQNQFHHNHLSL